MGLDAVELVLEVEDEFGIAIPDRDAERLRTVGDLHDYACRRVAGVPSGVCRSRSAFYALRRSVVARLGVDRRAVRPDARVEAHLPASGRRGAWAALGRDAGAVLPPLVPPTAVALAGLASVALLLAAMGIVPLVLDRTGSATAATSVVLAALASVVASAVACRWTATRPPAGCETYRGVVRRAVALDAGGGADRRRTEADVWERVVTIISEQTGHRRERVTRDLDLVRDLG